jgi:hypothetical protein
MEDLLSGIRLNICARKIADLYLADQFTESPTPRQRQRPRGERPNPVKLSSSQLQKYAGNYYSDELDITYTLDVESNNLVLKLRETSSTLTPYSTDNFGWGRRNLNFTRDREKRITGFVLQAGRVKNLRFQKLMNKKNLFFISFLLLLLPLILVSQTPPEEFLGHRVGADRKLADYNQIQAYFQKLDKESGKIKVLTIGQSTLNKPIIMAVITSEDNMAKLDTYRGISKKLRDVRGLTPDEARKLAKEGKVIVFITSNLHADEIGSSQMALEFAYKLVTGKTPFDADKILEDVIILVAPTINPDGQQMVTDWYRKYVGTQYEGGRMPWLRLLQILPIPMSILLSGVELLCSG